MINRSRTRLRAVSTLGLAVLLLLLAACGGDDSADSGDPAEFEPGSSELVEREDLISVTSDSLDTLDPEVATAVVERRDDVRAARADVLAFRSVPLPGPGRDFDHDQYMTFAEDKVLETDAYRMTFPGTFVEYESANAELREFRSYEPNLLLISVARLEASANVDERLETLGGQFLVEAERGRTGPFEWISFDTDDGRVLSAAGSIGELGLLVEARFPIGDTTSEDVARQVMESVRVLQ